MMRFSSSCCEPQRISKSVNVNLSFFILAPKKRGGGGKRDIFLGQAPQEDEHIAR